MLTSKPTHVSSTRQVRHVAIADDPNFNLYQAASRLVAMREQHLLGCAIQDLSGNAARDIVEVFLPEQFHGSFHRAVFCAIRQLIQDGAPDLDVGMVICEMQKQGSFDKFTGTSAMVCELTEGVVPPPTLASRLYRLEEMRRGWNELDAARKGKIQ